ncbi:unnamed protein product [Brassica oleracea var. botrytis]
MANGVDNFRAQDIPRRFIKTQGIEVMRRLSVGEHE